MLVLDSVDGLTSQDAHVAGYVVDEGVGLVVVLNKWDLVEKDDRTFDEYADKLRAQAPFLGFAPIVSVSAKSGQRVGRALDAAVEIARGRRRRIATGALNRVLSEATFASRRPPCATGDPSSTTRPRRPSSRPRSCCSRAARSTSTSATSATSRTGCATRSGSAARPIRIVVRERSRVDLEPRRRRSASGHVARSRAGKGEAARPAGGRSADPGRAAAGPGGRGHRRVGDHARGAAGADRARHAPGALPGGRAQHRGGPREHGPPAGRDAAGRGRGHRGRGARVRGTRSWS